MRNGHRVSGPRFKRDVSTQSRRIAYGVQELGRVAANGAKGVVENLGEKGRVVLKALSKATRKARAYLTANPAKSALIAVGLGAITGFLLRRRS